MMETYQTSIKQSAQQRGRKRYKLEGPKSWQTKIPHERKIAMGTRTNQVPKTQVMISMPDKEKGRTPRKMPSLQEPSPIIITRHKIEAAYSPYNATSTFYL
jgi:hypothetical protein